MLPDRIDGKQAEELFARLDGPGRGYLGAGKVLRILCSDTFTQRPGVARAVAAASVRASGGRLCKEAFLEAVRAGQSSAATEEARSCQHGLKAYDECLGGHVGFTRKVNLRGILSRQPQNEVLRNLIMSRLPEILACLRFRNMG
ncbi:unnamed protein product [Effrenium voratum]|nr:unnamed protein product [Effrenium voratum]